jgi:glycosyltransferase involved in cell wall biosynthesis
VNILYVTQYFPPDKGAAQIRAWEMAQNLSRLGHKITIVTEFPNHPLGVVPQKYRIKLFVREKYRGIEVIRTYVKTSPKKNFFNRIMFYFSFMISSIIAATKLKGKYDLVYATSSPLFVGLSGYIISRIKGIRFIFEIRDIWPDAAVVLGELKNKLSIRAARFVERFCYSKCDRVIVVTEGYRQNLLEKQVDPKKIHIIFNGANVDTFKPNRFGESLKRKYGYEGTFVALYAGNFGLIHGMNHLVEAARLLSSKDSIRFLFVGEGPMKAQITSLCAKYQLKNLEILKDVPTEQIVDYFSMADVCLVSTKKSKLTNAILPVKMFDAWACGKPIILSVDGEAREHLEKAKAGLWVEPENPHQITQAIKYLYDNPELCKRFGSNGRKYVERNFSRKVQAERLERILLEVLSESNG